MRILFAADVPKDPNSGAAGTEYQTIQALREIGHEIDEIWECDLPHRIRHGNLHYLIELPQGYCNAIEKRWKKNAYDVFHVNQSHCFKAAMAHKRQNRPGVFVCRSHGFEPRAEVVLAPLREKFGIKSSRWYRRILGKGIQYLLSRHHLLVTRYSDGMIVSCQEDRDFIIQRFEISSERIACIPQAPPQLFHDKPIEALSENRRKKILYIGGFGFWKGPHIVAQAANQLLDIKKDAQLTWVCEARSHDQAASLLSPEARLRTNFIPWQSQENLCAIYDAHGIFLFPSFFEGFGKTFLEAMSRGLCVIATCTGGMRDVIVDGYNGFHVDFEAVPEIVSKVKTLWEDPAFAGTISESARNTALQYSWNRVGRETAAFYKHLLTLPQRKTTG